MAKSMIAGLFGLAALILLFFKLPGVGIYMGFLTCQACTTKTLWVSLIGAAYFSALIATIFVFPKLPKCPWRYAGMVWALALPIFLYYLEPSWCTICFFAHLCHLGLWIFWKPRKESLSLPFGVKIILVCISVSAVTGLYAALNLTFLAT